MAPYTVIGTPFSTFTRTITLGLHYKGLEFIQKPTLPQSELALEAHPFGYLPTLLVHELNGRDVNIKLRESQAIAHFIERVAPEPALVLPLVADGPTLQEKVWEFVSITASFGMFLPREFQPDPQSFFYRFSRHRSGCCEAPGENYRWWPRL